MNDILLPALGIQESIVESTTRNWLKLKLGYQCKEVKCGIYINGHECPDMVKERKEFIEELERYDR